MRSGIKPDEELVEKFKNVKFLKSEKCWVMSINESQSKLEVLFKGGKDFAFKDLADQLPSNEPRFVVYDFDYETDERPPRKTNKLIFIFWCPMDSGANKRFKYSSSISEVVSTLGAIQKQFQIDDYSGIDYDDIRKQLLK